MKTEPSLTARSDQFIATVREPEVQEATGAFAAAFFNLWNTLATRGLDSSEIGSSIGGLVGGLLGAAPSNADG